MGPSRLAPSAADHLNAAPVIDVRGLTKRYREDHAVEDLSFAVYPGECFVFLGPNGAGKSTTIRMLTGMMPPSAGTAFIGGHDIATDTLAAKRAMGYMAEQPYLYDKLTGREFLMFIADVYGLSRRERDTRISELLRVFELEVAQDQLIEGYSLGMRQKTALASVLIHQPSVLFLDEPTNGLDPRSARIVKDVLRGIRDRGATIFMTTHLLEVAEQMCDRVAILLDGQLIALGTLTELRATIGQPHATLEDIFLELTGTVQPVEFDLYHGLHMTRHQESLNGETSASLARETSGATVPSG